MPRSIETLEGTFTLPNILTNRYELDPNTISVEETIFTSSFYNFSFNGKGILGDARIIKTVETPSKMRKPKFLERLFNITPGVKKVLDIYTDQDYDRGEGDIIRRFRIPTLVSEGKVIGLEYADKNSYIQILRQIAEEEGVMISDELLEKMFKPLESQLTQIYQQAFERKEISSTRQTEQEQPK